MYCSPAGRDRKRIAQGHLTDPPFRLDSPLVLCRRLTVIPLRSSRIAIGRGAVLSGFLQQQADQPPPYAEAVPIPVKVVSTIARASYGVVFMRPYDPALDRKEEVVWVSNEQGWYRQNLVCWYINRVSRLPQLGFNTLWHIRIVSG